MISSFRSEPTVWDIARRHDPDAWIESVARRPDADLPSDPKVIPGHLPVMLDTDVYIDRLKGKLSRHLLGFLTTRRFLHSAVAMRELTIAAGILDSTHPSTPGTRQPIITLLETMDAAEIVAPSPAAWIEAGMAAGILARTQHLNKSRKGLTPEEACCQQGLRRKLLNDALIFLSACEEGACLVSGNVKDMDLLLRFRPDAHVLLYRPTETVERRRTQS